VFDNAKKSQANTANSKQLRKTDNLRLSIRLRDIIGIMWQTNLQYLYNKNAALKGGH
jgi:hypothetical protein